MNKALVIGGSNGIGLSIVKNLNNYDHIYIVDKQSPQLELPDNISFEEFDLRNTDLSIMNKYDDINCLIITAGFGKLGLFKDVKDEHISDVFMVNTIAIIRIVKHFFDKINSKEDFYCAIMGSVSGYLSSPFFSVYGASKAAINKFIESVNVELVKNNSVNRILNVSPGAIKGTKFYQKENDLKLTTPLAKLIIRNMFEKNDLLIPDYDEIYKSVLNRYHDDFRKFGLESYDFKIKSIREE
jgi:short-subunit dehydrogenase